MLNWTDNAGVLPDNRGADEDREVRVVRRPVVGARNSRAIDPAIITVVHDGGDRILLGRQAMWPDKWYSTLAGFVEPGESLEQCVIREVREEVGITVTQPRYLGSQP